MKPISAVTSVRFAIRVLRTWRPRVRIAAANCCGDREGSSVQYRKATLADITVLAFLNQQLIEDEGSRTRMSLSDLEARMSQWLQDEYKAILFTQHDDIVAYALYRHDREAIYLRQFVVERRYRRRGIGRQAMHILLTTVWPPDWRVTLEVLAHNYRGQAFWRALGFRDYAITLERLPHQLAESH